MAKVTKAQAAERAEYRERLLAGDGWALAPGQTVYCQTIQIARSGMNRSLRLFVVNPQRSDGRVDGDLVALPESFPRASYGGPASPLSYEYGPKNLGSISDLTYMAAKAMGEKIDRHGGIGMGGCGYDTHHSLVDSLGRALGIPLRYRSL